VLEDLKTPFPSPFIIWAPRHVRRATPISQRLSQLEIENAKRSELENNETHCDVFILDTLGELSTALSLTNAVYLGGGLALEGGHNPLEPSFFGVPIASGKNVENHQQAFDMLIPTGSVCLVKNKTDILDFFNAEHHQCPDAITLTKHSLSKGVDDTLKLLFHD
jgi:3-deoxy-D-manno-octulosonic-acid transferase